MRTYRGSGSDAADTTAGVIILCLVLAIPAAWFTHVVWVISKLAGAAGVTGGQVLLGLLGTFVPPIGVIHGVMLWCGSGL